MKVGELEVEVAQAAQPVSQACRRLERRDSADKVIDELLGVSTAGSQRPISLRDALGGAGSYLPTLDDGDDDDNEDGLKSEVGQGANWSLVLNMFQSYSVLFPDCCV